MSSELERIDEEELLLIISGLGMPQEPTPETPEPDYWVSDECRECLSDLQRYLRRDNPNTMAFHRALGGWRVVQAHLLPILAKSAHDPKLVFSVLKIVVKLTMKPEQLGARMVEHLAEKKTPDPLVGKQLDELRDHHRAYKRAFLRPIASVPNMDAMGVLVRILSTPVAKPEANRSDEDTMLIELTLALLLNLLHTAPPDAPPPVPGKDAAARQDSVVLRQLLQRMHEEHAIDLLLYILQSVEDSPSHRNWNLTLLEIMYYVLSSHTPAQIFGAAADAPPTGAAAADDDDADADADGGDGDGAGEAAAASPAAAPAAPARTPAGGAGGGGEGAGGDQVAEDGAGLAAPGLQALARDDEPVERAAPLALRRRLQAHSAFGTQHIVGQTGRGGAGAALLKRKPRRQKLPLPARADAGEPNRRRQAGLRSSSNLRVTARLLPSAIPLSPPLLPPATTGRHALPGAVQRAGVDGGEGPRGLRLRLEPVQRGKVLPQDHTFFGATAAWMLEVRPPPPARRPRPAAPAALRPPYPAPPRLLTPRPRPRRRRTSCARRPPSPPTRTTCSTWRRWARSRTSACSS